MLGVFGVGRVLNAKIARSQLVGGMIWGSDRDWARSPSLTSAMAPSSIADLAEYHVPVNADIGEIDAIVLDETEDKMNPIGIKGLGRSASSAREPRWRMPSSMLPNIRVREFPVTLDKLLPGLPSTKLADRWTTRANYRVFIG